LPVSVPNPISIFSYRLMVSRHTSRREPTGPGL
jgi:hypothetical protein